MPEHPWQDVPVEIFFGVARIGSEYHLRVLTDPHKQRLMPRRMAIGGDEDHLAITEHVVFPVDELIAQRVVKVDHARTIARHAPGAPCRLHFRFLHQNCRMREKLIATAMVKVQMRVDNIRDIVRLQPCPSELADHVITHLRTDANPSCALFPHTANRIGQSLTVHTRVEEQPTLWVDHEITRHGYRPGHAWSEIGQHTGTVQLQIPNAQGIDLYHRSPPSVYTLSARHTVALRGPQFSSSSFPIHIVLIRRSHTTTKVASHEALGKNVAASPVTFPQETPMASNAEQTVHQIQHDCQNRLKRVAPRRS